MNTTRLPEMPRRSFMAMIAGGLLAAPLAAQAQQPTKIPRVGFLAFNRIELVRPVFEAFREVLRERGWVEGQTIVIEYRSAEGRQDRLPHLAAELVRLKVDVIVVGATQASLAAKDATKTIPLVMIISDPVGMGLVPSLARPGGNITAVTSIAAEIAGKQLELLKEVLPEVSRVAVLVNSNNPGAPLVVREAKAAARSLGLRLQILEVRDPGGFDKAFLAMTGTRAEALLVQAEALFFGQRDRIAQLAAKHRLPAMYGFREAVDAGGLMAYGANVPELFRRMALYVHKILKGTKPADLPIEQPTKFELVINVKTAKALGLTIPPSVLVRADEVIE